MRKFITSLFARRPARTNAKDARRPKPWTRLHVESLSERLMPSASLSYDGTLSIGGTYGNDTAVVTMLANGNVRVSLSESGGAARITDFNGARVKYIVFSGGDGNDVCYNATGLLSYQLGGNGNDYLVGGSTTDYLFGGDLYAEGYGNDTIFGGAGNDFMYGHANNDVLVGNAGNDTIYGGWGDDALYGVEDQDILFGEAGNDMLQGGSGNDNMAGGAGNDWLFGELGMDWLYGEDGNDYLDGGKDKIADALLGGTGSDMFITEWVQIPSHGWYNYDKYTDYNSYQKDVMN